MPSRGAPLGNKNNVKNKPWTEALRKALMMYEDDNVKAKKAIYHIAIRTVKDALDGDKDARQEISNRLDGKPVQPTEGPGDNGEHIVINRIEERIVDPDR